MLFLKGHQASYSASDHAPEAKRVKPALFHAAVLIGHLGSCHCQLTVTVSAPSILWVLVKIFRVKVLYLAANTAGKGSRIHVGDPVNAALALDKGLPELLKVIANGAQNPDSCYRYSSFTH
jgi:hypothetical protein